MKSENIVHPSELTELTPDENHEKVKSSRQLLESVREADWWVWEVLSLVISAIALVAIVLFLASLDDKPQPLWASAGRHCVTIPGTDQSICRQSGITVNSIVSWLGTLARICLLVPLSNGLGQLKWAWFSDGKDRPLADLDTFDAASRGVIGSVQLIFLLKARYLAAMGALGIMLSIAVDPFIQNLVGYHTKPVLVRDQIAFVANNAIYEPQVYLHSSGSALDINPQLKGSIFNALYSSDTRQVWSEPFHTCSTGECTWPPIASIGMCTSCTDTTASVQKSCEPADSTSDDKNCTLTLPLDEMAMRITSPSLSYVMLYGYNPQGRLFVISGTSGTVEIGPRKIASIYLDLNQQDAAKGKVNISEPAFKSSICTMSSCIQSIQSTYKQSDQTVQGSPYQEELLKSWTAQELAPESPSSSNFTAPMAPEFGLHGNQTFAIEGRTLSGFMNYLGNAFNGQYEKPGSMYNLYQNSWNDEDNDVVFALWNSNYTGCADAYKDNRVSCGLDLVAKAMSKTFRDAAYSANGAYPNGDAFAPVIHVNVTWYWITLPVLLWAFAFATFLGTVWKASQPGAKVWRNSLLPLVFMSVEGERKEVDVSVEGKALKKRSEVLRGVVRTTDGEVKFMSG